MGTGRQIDFCVISKPIAHLFDIRVIWTVPWSPHGGLEVSAHLEPHELTYQKPHKPQDLPHLDWNEVHITNHEWQEIQIQACNELRPMKAYQDLNESGK